MKPTISRIALLIPFLFLTACESNMSGASSSPPHLEKRGPATQLIVDGKPYLALAGELHNSSSSSVEYMKPIWPKLARMNLNTVLAVVSWEQVEPENGKFDFSVVDGIIADARANNLKLMLLWFGSWKNGTSRYEADWVKVDGNRFPRVWNKDGKTLEILSPLFDATREADARAYAALMRHLREIDSSQHTVIMMQMQNEVGILGDSRDRSPTANEAFAKPVPRELTDYLVKHKDTLLPEIKTVWESNGSKMAGSWEEIFGKGVRTDEIFMAWNYARFMNYVTEAGKAEYLLPTFVNAWIVQPEDKVPGDYPSGGPQAQNHDIWRAGAPAIDMLAPDIYLPDFPSIVAMYGRGGNPVFIPESRGLGGAANAYYAIGQFGAIGYSPFGIEDREEESGPLSKAYATLAQLAPVILEHQAKGTIAGVWLNPGNQSQKVAMGNYTLNVELRRNRRVSTEIPGVGYALIINLGPDEYLISGSDVQVTFTTNDSQGPQTVGLTKVEEGTYRDGQWVPGRRLNGDEVQLRYDLSQAASEGQAGTGIRLNTGGPWTQRVTLHRYQ